MNILILSSTFPYPPTKGRTQVRTFHLLRYLAQFHSITVVTQRDEMVTDADIETLREFVAELVVFPRPHRGKLFGILGKVTRFARFLCQGTPPSVLSNYSSEMQGWIDQAMRDEKFEIVTCEHSVNEIYIRSKFCHHTRTVINVHSSIYASCKHQLHTKTSENKLRDQLNLPLLKRYEQRYSRKFSHIVVTTDEDQAQMQALNSSATIDVIPNGVDFATFPYRPCDPGGHRLIFIGAMDNLANIDTVLFLSFDLLPALQQQYADATLTLVGARPTPEVMKLGGRLGITVTGQVTSIAEHLHQATVCVIPMRTGYGIKNKTLEAMAAGTPIVASDRGLEGLTVDGENVPLRALRANTITEYVNSIARLFEDAQLRMQVSNNARSLVETEYTWERAGAQYLKVLEQSLKAKID